MKLTRTALAVTATAILSLTASGARSVDWPADYESQLAAHVAAITPSGGNRAESGAFAGFDSVCEIVAMSLMGELRNMPVQGFQVIFR